MLRSGGRGFSFEVHGCLRDFGEFLVGFFFFIEGVSENLGDVPLPQQLGKADGTAVAGNFVVLHALGGGDEQGIGDCAGRILFQHLGALFDEDFHALAFVTSA